MPTLQRNFINLEVHTLNETLNWYLDNIFGHINPAGDVTRVSLMPRKVTVKIGAAENR